MTRRKKTLHIRVRRTSYERALTDATSALEKARAQQTKCLTDLERLTRQIPYLENVVQALTPPAEPGPVTLRAGQRY
jgi:predicted  nucleic acid-binding Zn-ribbon protein